MANFFIDSETILIEPTVLGSAIFIEPTVMTVAIFFPPGCVYGLFGHVEFDSNGSEDSAYDWVLLVVRLLSIRMIDTKIIKLETKKKKQKFKTQFLFL